MARFIQFQKMAGAGNDFILLDNRDGSIPLTKNLITILCDRHNGIGADGVLIVELPVNSSSDFKMRYFNRDGSEAEMCGNGARCFAKFASSLLPSVPEKISFDTLAGTIQAKLLPSGEVELAMSQPHSLDGPFQLHLSEIILEAWFLNTGVPHVLTFVEDLLSVPVQEWGSAIRYHQRFAPAGTNANFIQQLEPSKIFIRTYERGVEAETLACGTGATAAALIYSLKYNIPSPISVLVKSGDVLTIRFSQTSSPTSPFSDVSLAGPAKVTFTGEFLIPDNLVQ
ncbi:MAG: diaminopimelate epimerase [Chthoniobacterales bacterium]|nr:diaminopimelate epimerase [Chthoniobacterales bacterium]